MSNYMTTFSGKQAEPEELLGVCDFSLKQSSDMEESFLSFACKYL